MSDRNTFIPVRYHPFDFQRMYMISRGGDVYSLYTFQYLAKRVNSHGYECVTLTKSDGRNVELRIRDLMRSWDRRF